MKIQLTLVLSLLFLGLAYGQNKLKVIDIAFGEYALLSNITYSAQFIDNNEPHRVFNYLSSESKIEYDSLQSICNEISKFRRKSPQSFPAMMLQENNTLDTMYYERHYYILENNEIKFIGQLILKFQKNGSNSEIIDIEFYNSDTYLNRRSEIKSFHDEIWHKKVSNFKPTNTVKFESQVNYSSSQKISRNLNTSYKNNIEGFGFNYNKDQWKLSNKQNDNIDELTKVFGSKYQTLDILRNDINIIEIGKTESGTIIQNSNDLKFWIKNLYKYAVNNLFQIDSIGLNGKDKVITELKINSSDEESTIKQILISVHPYIYIVSIKISKNYIMTPKEFDLIANSVIYK